MHYRKLHLILGLILFTLSFNNLTMVKICCNKQMERMIARYTETNEKIKAIVEELKPIYSSLLIGENLSAIIMKNCMHITNTYRNSRINLGEELEEEDLVEKATRILDNLCAEDSNDEERQLLVNQWQQYRVKLLDIAEVINDKGIDRSFYYWEIIQLWHLILCLIENFAEENKDKQGVTAQGILEYLSFYELAEELEKQNLTPQDQLEWLRKKLQLCRNEIHQKLENKINYSTSVENELKQQLKNKPDPLAQLRCELNKLQIYKHLKLRLYIVNNTNLGHENELCGRWKMHVRCVSNGKRANILNTSSDNNFTLDKAMLLLLSMQGFIMPAHDVISSMYEMNEKIPNFLNNPHIPAEIKKDLEKLQIITEPKTKKQVEELIFCTDTPKAANKSENDQDINDKENDKVKNSDK